MFQNRRHHLCTHPPLTITIIIIGEGGECIITLYTLILFSTLEKLQLLQCEGWKLEKIESKYIKTDNLSIYQQDSLMFLSLCAFAGNKRTINFYFLLLFLLSDGFHSGCSMGFSLYLFCCFYFFRHSTPLKLFCTQSLLGIV